MDAVWSDAFGGLSRVVCGKMLLSAVCLQVLSFFSLFTEREAWGRFVVRARGGRLLLFHVSELEACERMGHSDPARKLVGLLSLASHLFGSGDCLQLELLVCPGVLTCSAPSVQPEVSMSNQLVREAAPQRDLCHQVANFAAGVYFLVTLPCCEDHCVSEEGAFDRTPGVAINVFFLDLVNDCHDFPLPGAVNA